MMLTVWRSNTVSLDTGYFGVLLFGPLMGFWIKNLCFKIFRPLQMGPICTLRVARNLLFSQFGCSKIFAHYKTASKKLCPLRHARQKFPPTPPGVAMVNPAQPFFSYRATTVHISMTITIPSPMHGILIDAWQLKHIEHGELAGILCITFIV